MKAWPPCSDCPCSPPVFPLQMWPKCLLPWYSFPRLLPGAPSVQLYTPNLVSSSDLSLSPANAYSAFLLKYLTGTSNLMYSEMGFSSLSRVFLRPLSIPVLASPPVCHFRNGSTIHPAAEIENLLVKRT